MRCYDKSNEHNNNNQNERRYTHKRDVNAKDLLSLSLESPLKIKIENTQKTMENNEKKKYKKNRRRSSRLCCTLSLLFVLAINL